MSRIIRVTTGLVIVFLSLWFIFSAGLFDEARTDYIALLTGAFFLLIGFFIIFNKKEDDVEQIKK